MEFTSLLLSRAAWAWSGSHRLNREWETLGTQLISSVPQPEEVGGTGEEPWDFCPRLGVKNPKDLSVEKLVPDRMLGATRCVPGC